MAIAASQPGQLPDSEYADVAVVVIRTPEPSSGRGPAATPMVDALVRAIVQMARRDELVLVYPLAPGLTGHQDAAALISRLHKTAPARLAVAVLVDDHPGTADQEFAMISRVLDEGGIPVAIAADPVATANDLTRYLDTETVLTMTLMGQEVALLGPQ